MRRRISLVWTGIVMLSLLFTSGGQVAAAAPDANGPARKIVVFQEGVSQAAQDNILEKAGAAKIKHLALVNAAVVMATPANERALAARAEVLRVEDDAVATILGKPAKPPPPAPGETLPWGVNRIDADRVWGNDGVPATLLGANTGGGIKVAVVDTGIDRSHPDLATNIKGGQNFVVSRGILDPTKWDDDNGHGTHVSGTIAGVDSNIGVIGVAPGAWLYAVKVLGRSGSGYVSDIIEGIEWCILKQIQVINMSLGTSSDVQSFHDAIIAAYNSGIVIVAAAGNSGPGDNTVSYPGAYPQVIGVSATDSADMIASFSSRGPEVDLAGPGVSIFSTVKGGGYATYSGTSMASPHVAGTVALVIKSGIVTDLDNNGSINNDDLRKWLQNTADDIDPNGKDNLYGWGLVDAKEAATGTP